MFTQTKNLVFGTTKIAYQGKYPHSTKVDTIVNIELPIPKSLFEEFETLGSTEKKGHLVPGSLQDFRSLLGEGCK